MKIYGYEIWIDGKYLVAQSYTFYSSEEEVKKELQATVPQICQEISDNLTGEDEQPFVWDEEDRPEETQKNLERVTHLVTEYGRIYERCTDSPYPIANNCPYHIELFIKTYTYKEKYND